MTKNKPGRPQKSAEEKRIKMSISLPPAVVALAKQKAKEQGVAVSAIIEAAVISSATPSPSVERLQALAATIRSAAGELVATIPPAS